MNTWLDFFEAYRIYTQRWSRKSFSRRARGCSEWGSVRRRTMRSKSHTSIVTLQYNILSLVKRLNDYETIGGLFREVEKVYLELTIVERIWEVIMDTVIAIANLFGLTDEEVSKVAICRFDELAHICRTIKLKAA
jgi:hypothetical protein